MENPLIWLLSLIAIFFLLRPLFVSKRSSSKKGNSEDVNLEPGSFSIEGEDKVYELPARNEQERNAILSKLHSRPDYFTTAFPYPDFRGGYRISVRESKK